jgi:CRP-like cAMP-binding protein
MPIFRSENFQFSTDNILDGLSAPDLEMLTSSSVTHEYKKGEIIFREGGIPTGIFYLKSGKIKKYKTTSRGEEQIFYICREGELLGYHAILSEEHYPDSAATIEESKITFIPKDKFLKVVHSSTVLSNKLLKSLAHEFSVFINGITNLATKSVRERIALNLLILDEKFKLPENLNKASEINISRGDFANMVGTAKETLVRILQEFKHDGLIESDGRMIRILNRKELTKKANFAGYASKYNNTDPLSHA